jgi:hypothetical protein
MTHPSVHSDRVRKMLAALADLQFVVYDIQVSAEASTLDVHPRGILINQGKAFVYALRVRHRHGGGRYRVGISGLVEVVGDGTLLYDDNARHLESLLQEKMK